MASHEAAKIMLSKIGQRGHSERLCKLTNINNLIQKGAEWMKGNGLGCLFKYSFL
jgi:hypothetical protein